jgi:outer membrane protein assembly factor BamA
VTPPARLLATLLLGTALCGRAQEAAAQVRIAAITVLGNAITKERVVLRELLVHEDERVPAAGLYDLLERSRQNLLNLGLFNTVAVLPIYIDSATAVVEVEVHERWTLWPAPIFQLADPNFNTWWLTRDADRINYGVALNKYNFRGRNETLFLKAQFGYARQFAVRYKVPGIDPRQRWGLTVRASLVEQAEVTAATVGNKRVLVRADAGVNRRERKAEAELGFRPGHDVRYALRIGAVHAEAADTVVRTALDYFRGASGDTRYLTLGYTITSDRRDWKPFPTAGHYAELRIDRFGLGFAEANAPGITTAYAAVKRWWRLSEPLILALGAQGKATAGTPPYYVQEGLGYQYLVRGHEYYVVDGEHLALGKANLLLQLLRPRSGRLEAMPTEAFRPFYLALYLNAFVDAGRVWDSRYAAANPLANTWLTGYGLGLDLVSSYDLVVRTEYSLNGLGEHGFFLHFTQPF